MDKIRAAFFNKGQTGWMTDPIGTIYGRGRREQLERLTRLHPLVISEQNFWTEAPALREVEAIFSCWGMPNLTQEHLDAMPKLRALFYAGGSVKGLAPLFHERDIKVISAWAANAESVAEFCLGQILLACKGYFRNTRDCRTPEGNRQEVAFHGHGTYGETIALIGAGKIARCLIRLLMPFRLHVLVVDPYLAPDEAVALGVNTVTLDEAFREGYVVSNHLPDFPILRNLLHAKHFRSMRNGATFINTGRGAQVNEEDLITVFQERPDLTALLDVTQPQPCAPDSPLYRMPNVQLTSHLAGAHHDEVLRMADLVIEEFQRWQSGAPLRYEVTAPMLERLA